MYKKFVVSFLFVFAFVLVLSGCNKEESKDASEILASVENTFSFDNYHVDGDLTTVFNFTGVNSEVKTILSIDSYGEESHSVVDFSSDLFKEGGHIESYINKDGEVYVNYLNCSGTDVFGLKKKSDVSFETTNTNSGSVGSTRDYLDSVDSSSNVPVSDSGWVKYNMAVIEPSLIYKALDKTILSSVECVEVDTGYDLIIKGEAIRDLLLNLSEDVDIHSILNIENMNEDSSIVLHISEDYVLDSCDVNVGAVFWLDNDTSSTGTTKLNLIFKGTLSFSRYGKILESDVLVPDNIVAVAVEESLFEDSVAEVDTSYSRRKTSGKMDGSSAGANAVTKEELEQMQKTSGNGTY